MIKRTIYILLILGIASIVVIFFYVNKPVKLTQNIETDLEIFTNVFEDLNTQKKNFEIFKSFIEKVVLFEGEIKKISLNKEVYTLVIYSEKIDGELICSFQMDQNDKMIKLNKGNMIRVKGIYKGFLTNMIFQNCILK